MAKRKVLRKKVTVASSTRKTTGTKRTGSLLFGMDVDIVHMIAVFQLPEFQKYKVLSFIGSGHFGSVLLVHDKTKQKNYALKISLCYQKDKKCLTEECRVQKAFAAARLAPKVIDCGHVKHGSVAVSYVLMDYVQGVTLRIWMGEKTRTPKEMDALFRAMAKMWKKMAAKKLGHEDAHDSNTMVVLDKGGRFKDVKLVDFGHARTNGFNVAMIIERLYISIRFFEAANQENANMFRERLFAAINRLFRGGMKSFGKKLLEGKAQHRRDFRVQAF